MHDIPINGNLLWTSQSTAMNCPKGDIKLAFCPRCSYIFNLDFEPERQSYDKNYENSLFYSPHFQRFAKTLANNLIERYDLHGKDLIEIGLGKSNFLSLLCELGNNNGVSFDPTQTINREEKHTADRIKIIPDFYSEKYSEYKPDFIFSWHVLEHINDPKAMLTTIRRAVGDREEAALFFSVPNALHNFRSLLFWDIIYEHLSYFTKTSLSYIFRTCGFRVNEITEEHEGQSLCISATPDKEEKLGYDYSSRPELKQIKDDVAAFSDKYYSKLGAYEDKLKTQSGKRRVVMWGAGSRGVTFLNTLKNLEIDYAVDINPKKQGMYIPGTGQKIVPPEFLRKYRPDMIIIMNSIYKGEIRDMAENIHINPEFFLV